MQMGNWAVLALGVYLSTVIAEQQEFCEEAAPLSVVDTADGGGAQVTSTSTVWETTYLHSVTAGSTSSSSTTILTKTTTFPSRPGTAKTPPLDTSISTTTSIPTVTVSAGDFFHSALALCIPHGTFCTGSATSVLSSMTTTPTTNTTTTATMESTTDTASLFNSTVALATATETETRPIAAQTTTTLELQRLTITTRPVSDVPEPSTMAQSTTAASETSIHLNRKALDLLGLHTSSSDASPATTASVSASASESASTVASIPPSSRGNFTVLDRRMKRRACGSGTLTTSQGAPTLITVEVVSKTKTATTGDVSSSSGSLAASSVTSASTISKASQEGKSSVVPTSTQKRKGVSDPTAAAAETAVASSAAHQNAGAGRLTGSFMAVVLAFGLACSMTAGSFS